MRGDVNLFSNSFSQDSEKGFITLRNQEKKETKTNSQIQVFTFQDSGVRVIVKGNEPLFCLADICATLEIKNRTDLKNAIDKEFDKGGRFNLYPLETKGGKQNFSFISEPELYFVLMRSDKPQAKPFRRWVVNDVLPSIKGANNHNAQYSLPQTYTEQNNTIKISTLEIAKLTGKRHDHILRDCEVQLTEKIVGAGGLTKFGETYIHPQNKQSYRHYMLPKREALILVSGYSAELRAVIIDRLEFLEQQAKQQFKAPTNMIEALELALAQQKQIVAQEKQITEQKQVIEYQESKLDGYKEVEKSRRSKAILAKKLNQYVRIIANQKFNGSYQEAYNYIYNIFSEKHFITEKINMDYLKKNMDYLQECVEIALSEMD